MFVKIFSELYPRLVVINLSRNPVIGCWRLISTHYENEISKLNKKNRRWLKILISEARFAADASSKIKGALKKDLLPIVSGALMKTQRNQRALMVTMKNEKVLTMRISGVEDLEL